MDTLKPAVDKQHHTSLSDPSHITTNCISIYHSDIQTPHIHTHICKSKAKYVEDKIK